MSLWDDLRSAATQHGIAGLGVTAAEPFHDVAATLTSRRDAGLNGSLKFTFRDPQTSTDVRLTCPWARSIITGSMPYLPAAGSPGPVRAGYGRIARFAVDLPYVELRAALQGVASVLAGSGYRTRLFVDDNRLVDRAAAVRSGVGWWGKNTMVLDPRHGPWLVLGSVVSDAALPQTSPMVRDCGTCAACIPACPTGALVEPSVLDARRCLAHWAQSSAEIPADMRRAMEDRFYGCDDCLEACPPGARLLETATRRRGRVEAESILQATDTDLLEQFGHLYIPKRNPDYLRRNAIVVLANTGERRHVWCLVGFLDHPSHMLRTYARWAIAEIGGAEAEAILGSRAASPPAV